MKDKIEIADEIKSASNALRRAEILLADGYEDEALHEAAKEIAQAKCAFLKTILVIVDRAVQTENQQRKWLVAIRQIDSRLEDAEDEFTGDTFDLIRNLRRTISDSFDE